MAEMLQHGLLREGAFGTEEGHLERLLLRKACRHDLAKEAHDLFVRKRAALLAVTLERHAQNLGLALGPIEIHGVAGRVLRDADLLRELGALVDECVQLRVDVVDADADPLEPWLARARCGLRLWRLPAGHGYSSRAPSTPGMARSRSSTSAGIGASVSISV